MNKLYLIILTILSISTFAQKNLNKEAGKIIAEGKILYKSEMASWYGTDLFLEKYSQRENIGGYFSYVENEIAKCIFFSRSEDPMVIGMMSFDESYNIQTAAVDLKERKFSKNENDLFTIRKIALAEINADTLFKTYKNTNLNLIPIIKGKERKVYVLTGPSVSGAIIFGNDYLLTFDKDNKLLTKRALHNNIISIPYGSKDGETGETMHSHLPETGDFITATDICTLMLYEKFAKWTNHSVVSKKHMSIWNCKNDTLTIVPMDAIKKINQDQE